VGQFLVAIVGQFFVAVDIRAFAFFDGRALYADSADLAQISAGDR
jgi:hypothetical protein